MSEENDVLAAIELNRARLEQDVAAKAAALEEAKMRLSAFRASALSALGQASGSKSAQKQRAERQAVVAKMVAEGLSRAEIVRRTGLVDYLVGYDIDCIRKRRRKQGEKRVFARSGESGKKASSASDASESSEATEDNAGDVAQDPEPPEPMEPSEKHKVEKSSAPPSTPFASDKPGQPGIVRAGCSASRDQLKSAAKAIQRSGRKTCYFVTASDNNHSHVAALDLMGDGTTLADDTKHRHRICHFEMLESDHYHGITLEEK